MRRTELEGTAMSTPAGSGNSGMLTILLPCRQELGAYDRPGNPGYTPRLLPARPMLRQQDEAEQQGVL